MEHEITVELKNEVQIRGTLKSVDQYLNIKLDNAEAVDEVRWPHLVRGFDYMGPEEWRVRGTVQGEWSGVCDFSFIAPPACDKSEKFTYKSHRTRRRSGIRNAR